MVALMSRLHAGPIHTFSIGYAEDGYDEGGYATDVARHLGTDHRHLVMRPDAFAEAWPSLVRRRDAPLSIPHEIPLYELSRQMKQSISVALAGDGADELFGGYGRVLRGAMDWKKVRAARAVLGGRLAARVGAMPRLARTPLAWLGCTDQMQHFFQVYNWIPFEEKWSLLTPEARSAIDGDARTVGVFEDAFAEAEHADPYDRVLHVFQKIHLGCLLDKLDAMAMAASIEGRVPFVDHRLVELVVPMPIEHKLRWNSTLDRIRGLATTGASASERLDTTKVALRRVGERLLPESIAHRKKLGFPTPLDAWLDAGMLDLAREILLDPVTRARGIFEPAAVRRLLDTRDRLPYDFHGKKVWMLANVELWLREVVDAPAGP
jgi:asparagine synthase (glutamine-hydrolysing)